MSKKFQIVNFDGQGPSTSCAARTDWKLCLICQEHTPEALRCPLQSKEAGYGSGYTSLVEHLIQFNDLGQLPSTLPFGRLDEGHGIEAVMVENKARDHQTCRLKYNDTMLKRAKKRAYSEESCQQSECKLRRSQPIRALAPDFSTIFMSKITRIRQDRGHFSKSGIVITLPSD